jgi:hypothetical protein
MDIFKIRHKIEKYSFKLMNGSGHKKELYQKKYDIYRNILKQHGGGLCSVCFKNSVNRLYAYDDFYMCESCKTCVCGDCLTKKRNICPNENKETKWEEYDEFDPVLIDRMMKEFPMASLKFWDNEKKNETKPKETKPPDSDEY